MRAMISPSRVMMFWPPPPRRSSLSSYANKKCTRLYPPLCSDIYVHTYLVFLEAHHHELKDELVDGGCEGGEADENENE